MSGMPIQKRKLASRYAPVVFGLLTSATFALIMSGMLLLVNPGFLPGFLTLWMRSFGVAFAVAFPTLVIVVSLIRRLVATIVGNPNPDAKPAAPGAKGR